MRPEIVGRHVYEESPFGYLAVAGRVLGYLLLGGHDGVAAIMSNRRLYAILGVFAVALAASILVVPTADLDARRGWAAIGGAILGGFIIGSLENLTGLYLDPVFGVGVKDVAPFIILVLIIMIRPYGLFGKKIIERV